MYNHAPQSENIEAKLACRGLLYRKRFMRSNFRQTTDTHSSIAHKSSPPLDTNSSTTNSLDKRFSTNAPESLPLDMNSAAVTSVICLRGVPMVVAAFVKRVKMLWWAASFSLGCKSLGVSFSEQITKHGHVKTRQCIKIIKVNYLASLFYIIFGNWYIYKVTLSPALLNKTVNTSYYC